MASTSMTLGPHWEDFIQEQIQTGRFKNASEVVRAGLRELETEAQKLSALRAAIQPGLEEADRGEFAENFDMQAIITGAVARAQKPS